MIRACAIAFVALVSIRGLYGQAIPDALGGHPAHAHHMQGAAVIDGATNPEQIPDSAAYRLFLIAVAEEANPTSDQRSRQIAFLRSAGLDDIDVNDAIPILADFKTRYGDLIRQYNEAVMEDDAHGVVPDLMSFLRRRERLVQSTRDALAAALSSDGMARFHAHVQSEKRRMKVAAKEGQ